MEEVEAKYLRISPSAIEKKLRKLGAHHEFSRTYRVITFDYPDLRLNQQAAWIRLRDEGDRITLAFKQRQGVKQGQNDTGMLEYEVTVSDFQTTATIFRRAGFIDKFREEKRRSRWILDGVEIDIDEMPLLEPYLEIEAQTWEQVDAMALKLGFDPQAKTICSAFQVYELAGINMLDYQILTFEKQVKRGRQ